MADNELHPVVELLLARMKSNPEEFESLYAGRWHSTLAVLGTAASKEEQQAIHEALRIILLDKAHADAINELLNREEPRAVRPESTRMYNAQRNKAPE